MANNQRLKEIAAMKFGELADDAVSQILDERRHLTELGSEYEKLRQEEEERLLLEKQRAEQSEAIKKQKQALAKKIEKLNQSISPDKADDDLLALIAERKTLEKELENLETDSSGLLPPAAPPVAATEISQTDIPPANLTGSPGAVATEMNETVETSAEKEPTPSFKASLKEEFGKEGIEEGLPEGGELQRYLNQLKNNTGSLGTLLQEMPADAKKNKAFMLQVAKIDPAYAMHYADVELKRNDDFNIRVAVLKNPRNSGNALAEMLPEARTSRVVLTAVKQDYRNIKFVQPNMADYDEMMRIAKKAALENLKSLKNAADMSLLIPRPLQQDAQFMAEAKEVIAENNKPAV